MREKALRNAKRDYQAYFGILLKTGKASTCLEIFHRNLEDFLKQGVHDESKVPLRHGLV